MIGVVDVKIQAANPSMPLYPMRAFIGSPSSIRVREVPKKIGDWQITKVYFTAEYPDDSIKTAECVLVGGVYVGTIAGSSVSGTSTNGYTIFADGTDENGNEVHGYVLGKGDIQILEADGTITPSEGGTKYYVHLLSAQAATPNDGDMWQDDGSWYIWQDGQAWAIGDESGAIGELTERVDDLEEDKQDKLTDAQMSAINSVVDERATVVTYLDSSVSSFNIVGELNDNSISGRNNVADIKIGTGVTSIGNSAFQNCTGLTNVTIPDSVTSIGAGAFYQCSGLTSVTIGSGVTSIGESAFSGCIGLTSVTIPNSVTSIGGSAFNGCSGLTSVTIPNGVTSIGNQAFSYCTSLTNVTIGNSVTSVGEGAFWGCSGLTSVTILNSVTRIGDYAFFNCIGLASVTIPDSVTSIGEYAFDGCSSLKTVFLPKTLANSGSTIGANAFSGTNSHIIIYFKDISSDFLPLLANYPWGVDPSAIQTWNDASQEWVKEQAYGQQYGFKVGNIAPRPPRLMNLTPYKVTTFTVAYATNPFTITPTGDAGNMREYYLSLTLNVATSVIWASSIDVFKGGDASALAPVIGLNIYHILEYTSGHFMVEKMV